MDRPATPSRRPDIVFLLTDDQRFDMISGLGHPDVQTPNMDRLLERGTALTEAHIPGGLNPAICMPSRGMLHTGRNLFRLENDGETIPVGHATLGETLKEAGYHCFGSGKWHNGFESFNRSFHDGAEIFFGGMCDHWNVPCFDYDPTGAYEGTIRFTDNWFYSNRTRVLPGDRTTPGTHSSTLIADAGIRYLRERRPSDQPSFLYLSFLAPHDPRTMPDEYRDLYDPGTIRLPANFKAEHDFDYGIRDVRDERLAGYPRTEAEVRRHIAEYYAMVTHLDHEIGRVIDEVEASGRLENTLFILAGDNGLAVGQHGLFGKQNAYEHSIRVPLLFAGPGIGRNRRDGGFVYLLDIFPTLCEYLGLDIPDSVDGHSFLSLIDDRSDDSLRSGGRETVSFAYSDLLRAIKDREHKLIEYRCDGRNRVQLFHHREDPEELVDLSEQSGCSDRVSALQQALRREARLQGDTETDAGSRFWGPMNDLEAGESNGS